MGARDGQWKQVVEAARTPPPQTFDICLNLFDIIQFISKC